MTATVASPALIASSVMSKKLAGGAAHVLLDVKVGDGAFLPDVGAGRDLAQLCVAIGEANGRRTAALVTDMSQPLGDGVGNAIEVGVAIEVLRGERPGRLAALAQELGAAALALTGVSAEDAAQRIAAVLSDGRALERFREMVAAQGGDPSVVDDPWNVLPAAPVVRSWTPPAGVVGRFACRRLGELAGRLGAGRMRQGDEIDPAVGLEILVRTGDRLDGEAPAVRVHARSEEDAERVLEELPGVVEVGDDEPAPVPLVHARIGLADRSVGGSTGATPA